MPSDVIGIELIDGSVWFCPHSVLSMASGGSYFVARFGTDSMIPAGEERTDQHGRSIYFIARDGQLFGNYILPYLLTNHPGQLPSFAENPVLWRALRREADFFGLDSLSNMLHITKTFTPDNGRNDKGVLYWLGTDKGRNEYQNPYSTGAVDVTGWVDMSREECEANGDRYNHGSPAKISASLPSSRQALVQYRPSVKGFSAGESMLQPSGENNLDPVIVDLKTITLNVTAYSLRYDLVMVYWNLEGSVDGNSWDMLHAARNEDLSGPSPDEFTGLERSISNWNEQGGVPKDEQLNGYLLDFVERKYRRFFHIESNDDPVFYRFIRFTNVKRSRYFGRLRGAGLELYGNVHEE